jgi:hypothetical protein
LKPRIWTFLSFSKATDLFSNGRLGSIPAVDGRLWRAGSQVES